MNSFTFNKIAGAVLAALLIGFAVIEISHALYPNPRHEVHVAQMGYPVAADHGDDGGHGGEATVEEAPDLGTLLANASADRGMAAVRACASCHSFDQGGPNGQGPNLWDIVDRPVASHEGFNYSRAMAEHGGTWTYELLFTFLQRPAAEVPGTIMNFPGVRRDSQRADILAYLQTLSDNPVPFPAPVEHAAEETMDHAEDAAHDTMEAGEDAMHEAGDAAEETMDHAGEAMDDAGEAMEDAAEEAEDTMGGEADTGEHSE